LVWSCLNLNIVLMTVRYDILKQVQVHWQNLFEGGFICPPNVG
jgi:hypothetical protein